MNVTQSPPQAQPQYVITSADKKRQQDIAFAWKSYDGDLDKPLEPMPDQADDNVLENQCAPIVDGGVNFLFGLELEITAEEDAPADAQILLDAIWQRKERRIPLLQDLAYNGAMAGNAFLRIVPGPRKTYRLVAVDPATVFVKTAPQDCETVLLWCIEYLSIEEQNGKPSEVFYREEISRVDPDQDGDNGDSFADTDATWEIQHWTRNGDNGPWQIAVDAKTQEPGDPITWPYPFPPIFSCKNLPRPNSFWGRPDLTRDIIGLNNALNLNESNINRIGKMYGAPILYSTGAGEGAVDVKPGVITGLGVDGKIVAVTLTSDTPNMLSFSENVRSNIDEISSYPGIATGRLSAQPRGDMSGVAIELLFMPTLKKTDGKRCRYGDLIINVSKALLVLNGISGAVDVSLAWSNPLPHDDLPAVQAAVAKMPLGISKETLQRELGYDPDQEALLNQAEDAQTVTNYSRGVGLPPAQPSPAQEQNQLTQPDASTQQQQGVPV